VLRRIDALTAAALEAVSSGAVSSGAVSSGARHSSCTAGRARGRRDHEGGARVAWLREVPDQARHAGLANHADARALAALLDVLAAELPLWVPEPCTQPLTCCFVAALTRHDPAVALRCST
jgi:hypothetical protein